MLFHLWVIAFVPLVASILILLFGKRLPARGAELGIGAMGVISVLSLIAAIDTIRNKGLTVVQQYEWFSYGETHVYLNTIGDGFSAMMLLVVSVVSLLVQIYSTNYMRDDKRFTHFFAILTLFTGGMQLFVMSGNTLQMLFGWELIGLCSFILIGHWWEERSNVNAAVKAFLTTRLSDIGFILGIIVLFFGADRSFNIVNLNQLAPDGYISHGLLLAGTIGLLIAVIGKSAQFPLHTWLPDAMAGPTPVSALIHAATMVVAGVYLIGRLFPVFGSAFSIPPFVEVGASVINPVAVVGAITIVIAALLAFVQRDIKKILAYSTVSQLGYMIMALGVGAWVPAIFHLFTHAFFKSLLFLGAGSVSHVVHGFDIEKDMGGLRKKMPVTHATFAIGTLALIGVIPLSGFWSKEQIVQAAGANGYVAFQVVAIVGTLLTAGYMTRLYCYVFLGKHRGHSVPHESPAVLTVPLVVLAALAAVAGFLNAPLLDIHFFADWVSPFEPNAQDSEAGLNVASVIEILVAVAGIAISWFLFTMGVGLRRFAEVSPVGRGAYKLLNNRYYLDWLYEGVLVRGVTRVLAMFVRWVDQSVVDGIVNDSGAVAEGSGAGLSRVQSGRVQRYAAVMLGAVALAAVVVVVTV